MKTKTEKSLAANLSNKAKVASKKLMSLSHETRKLILKNLATSLKNNKELIKTENSKDMENAKNMDLSKAMLDRLLLTDERIEGMIKGVLEISEAPDVVNTFSHEFKNKSGLTIKRQRVPLGAILMIFESRPNVVVDCAALSIKSSNAIILKGGKEAKFSNEILGKIIRESLAKYIPEDSVQVLASDDRSVVTDLLSEKDNIDVVIPRGGHRLIEFVSETAKMPVIAHFNGLCHMYIDEFADSDKAVSLAINAKTHRTGVCNAMETLIIHEKILPTLGRKLLKEFAEHKTELRVDQKFNQLTGSDFSLATEEDWNTEYLENILSIKTVSSIDEAIDHIDQYGSFHSESIVSENSERQNQFLNNIDASCVMINASTRFNDGGELGLGAELGISTTKIHAYGPMGAEQMTTSRYVLIGDGHIRK